MEPTTFGYDSRQRNHDVSEVAGEMFPEGPAALVNRAVQEAGVARPVICSRKPGRAPKSFDGWTEYETATEHLFFFFLFDPDKPSRSLTWIPFF